MATNPNLLMVLTGLALLATGWSLEGCEPGKTGVYIYPKYIGEWCEGQIDITITKCIMNPTTTYHGNICAKPDDVKQYLESIGETVASFTAAHCRKVSDAFGTIKLRAELLLNSKYIYCNNDQPITDVATAVAAELDTLDTSRFCTEFSSIYYFKNLYLYNTLNKMTWTCTEPAKSAFHTCHRKINQCLSFTDAVNQRLPTETSNVELCKNLYDRAESTPDLNALYKPETCHPTIVTVPTTTNPSTTTTTTTAPTTTTTTNAVTSTASTTAAPTPAPATSAPTGPEGCTTVGSADTVSELCTWEDTWSEADEVALGPFDVRESACDFSNCS